MARKGVKSHIFNTRKHINKAKEAGSSKKKALTTTKVPKDLAVPAPSQTADSSSTVGSENMFQNIAKEKLENTIDVLDNLPAIGLPVSEAPIAVVKMEEPVPVSQSSELEVASIGEVATSLTDEPETSSEGEIYQPAALSLARILEDIPFAAIKDTPLSSRTNSVTDEVAAEIPFVEIKDIHMLSKMDSDYPVLDAEQQDAVVTEEAHVSSQTENSTHEDHAADEAEVVKPANIVINTDDTKPANGSISESSPRNSISPSAKHSPPDSPRSDITVHKRQSSSHSPNATPFGRPGTALANIGPSTMFDSLFTPTGPHISNHRTKNSRTSSHSSSSSLNSLTSTISDTPSTKPAEATSLINEMSTTLLSQTPFTTFFSLVQSPLDPDSNTQAFNTEDVCFAYISCVALEHKKLDDSHLGVAQGRVTMGMRMSWGDVGLRKRVKLGEVSLEGFLELLGLGGVGGGTVSDGRLWEVWKEVAGQ
ncbi:hypothetical protein P280DRAFT_548567 [Massarina eburnea CBS 473.64]|uniref:Uncharacterized protein n=1 Tax=Massarina eburnea CBS 473.64 TaxID=1395130 RepID=A0A6A6S4A2_9PLEO|nr:hypothetical protein P280DRAFT_548567 [Massarina eburnea CBS 473.64]